ncbi:hypothetical protein QAD02_021979 [Eretmocerus hayati]|uniref:Uncharacterized protein n=1 Tax=Eretmocerus hayati TaxID=131215 RepID=A0ACC2PRE9_9HYME|nr:hypothetical protein QAD02_021979 [Eretmocerus hayati]
MPRRRIIKNQDLGSAEPEIDVVTVGDSPYLDPCDRATNEIEEAASRAMNQAHAWTDEAPINRRRPPSATVTSNTLSGDKEIAGHITNQPHAQASVAGQLMPATVTHEIFIAADTEAAKKSAEQARIWTAEFRTLKGQAPATEEASSVNDININMKYGEGPSTTNPIQEETSSVTVDGKNLAVPSERETRPGPGNFDAETWQEEIKAAEELAQRGFAGKLLFLLKEKIRKDRETAGTSSVLEEEVRSAPRKFDIGDWQNEQNAAKELAQQGLANKLLLLLREKSQQDQEAANLAREYIPAPIGTPQLPPMPMGVPIRTYLSSTHMQVPEAAMIIDQHEPLDLTAHQTDSIVKTTARMGPARTATSTYTGPISATGLKRRYDDVSNEPSGDQQVRSLFTSTVIRERRCFGPALGVPVGKIPTNPWVAPQTEAQRRLLEAILTGTLKIGLLKANDGRIIMRRKGFIWLQPDNSGWRCGACNLTYPKKYNNWLGWIGHEIHQVGILDEFARKGFIIICPDCGRNPVSPMNFDDCIDAVLTCARHWDDINSNVIMEVIPVRSDCLCNRPPARMPQFAAVGTSHH